MRMSIGVAFTILAILTAAPVGTTADLGLVRFLNGENSRVATMRGTLDARESEVSNHRANESLAANPEVTISKLDEEEEPQNCTPHSIDEFPKDLFTPEQRRNGAVILHTLFGFYCFLLTAFVCNDYLLPSLDLVCAHMKISADVAGATFLATASCFPELFVNVVGTFLTASDLGVGTVMGGAVFNTFATPACGALSAIRAIQLEWRILTRDCIMYVISVSVLVIIMWDALIEWYEATILMVLFAVYLMILFGSKTFARWYKKLTHLCSSKNGSTEVSEEKFSKSKEETMADGLYKPYFHGELVAEYKKKTITNNDVQKPSANNEEAAQNNAEPPPEDYVEPNTPFVWPTGGRLAKFWFWFVWPLKLILFVTVPDSRYKRWKNWYLLTFIMCVIWIAISSYLVSWMMTVLGDTLGIPDSVMGITFLSAGGNMPELVSIVILSKQGNGDMAMSNTIGANTLDILLCLGLPWLIKTLMSGKSVQIVSGALSYSVLSIIVCVIAFYVVIALCKYQLNKKVGIICLILYMIFLVFAILIELNVFFKVNLPAC